MYTSPVSGVVAGLWREPDRFVAAVQLPEDGSVVYAPTTGAIRDVRAADGPFADGAFASDPAAQGHLRFSQGLLAVALEVASGSVTDRVHWRELRWARRGDLLGEVEQRPSRAFLLSSEPLRVRPGQVLVGARSCVLRP